MYRGKAKFSGNEEIYIIGADNACMIPGNTRQNLQWTSRAKKAILVSIVYASYASWQQASWHF